MSVLTRLPVSGAICVYVSRPSESVPYIDTSPEQDATACAAPAVVATMPRDIAPTAATAAVVRRTAWLNFMISPAAWKSYGRRHVTDRPAALQVQPWRSSRAG